MSKTLVFDIETNGLLLEVDKFWVGITYCIETKEEKVYHNATEMVKELNKANTIIGHNIVGYDIPVLNKLTGDKVTGPRLIDTYLLAKLVYYDKDRSWSHSLDAYGQRLGFPKGKYSDWTKYTPEMEEYCKQDVLVTTKLYQHLNRKRTWLPDEALELEQDVQRIVTQQYINGWRFDEEGAKRLHCELVGELSEAEEELFSTFKPLFMPQGKVKKPKRPFQRLGITTLGEHQPIKLMDFNPGSGTHIVWWVQQLYGKQQWRTTDKGTPRTDGESLLEMFEGKEWAKPLLHYQEVKKLLGQLAEGEKAWLKQVHKDGRLHGSMDILGAVTGRATHSNPNLGQVPSPRAYKGEEARRLFISSEGMVNVGCDLSGVELRCLAHYMHPFDKGRYSDILLNGDIHTATQEAAGLPTRDVAKTFSYSVLYGAGDSKVGTLVQGGAKEGKKLKAQFEKNTPGYKQLTDAVKKAAKRGYLIGISGRRLYVRSPHSALNTLLQSLGSYISKYWMVEVHKRITEEGIICRQIGWIHDELQFECKREDSEKLAKILEESSLSACTKVGIRLPINSESDIGKDWFEVH